MKKIIFLILMLITGCAGQNTQLAQQVAVEVLTKCMATGHIVKDAEECRTKLLATPSGNGDPLK